MRLVAASTYTSTSKPCVFAEHSAQSTEQNVARLDILKTRDEVLRKIYEDADLELATLAKDEPEKYSSLLSDLIIQALIKLSDTDVVVRCREADLSTIKRAIPAVSETYVSKTGKPVNVTVDDSTFLGENCTGGVTLISNGGRIVVENTLESRLEVAYQQNLPLIRDMLFDN